MTADSSTRLPGDRQARADAAVDGDATTDWIAALGPQNGEWLSYELARPLTFDHLDLQVVTDGRHSVPTRLTVSAGAQSRTVELPPLPTGAGRPQNAVTPVHVSFPALTGTKVRVTVDSVRELTQLDYYGGQSGRRDILPVALAEVGLPGATRTAPPAQTPAVCRADLVSIDGRPVDVAVSGPTGAALAGRGMTVSPCGNSAGGISLAAGTHVVRTSPWFTSGWQIDQLWLGSERGGAALASTPSGALPAPTTGTAPAVRVTHEDRTHVTAEVSGPASAGGRGFWLVLGQSVSRGWSAQLTSGGKTTSLGPPQLIDGYANGWYVPAGTLAGPGPATVRMSWTPQRVVWAALVLSALGLLVSLGLALVPRRRRPEEGPEELAAPELASPLVAGGARPRAVVVAAAAVAAGIVAGAISSPWAAAPIAVVVLAACLWDRARALLTVGAVGAMAATGAYMVLEQARHGFLPTILWPGSFNLANSFGWATICLLGADALVVTARLRASMGASPSAAPGTSPGTPPGASPRATEGHR